MNIRPQHFSKTPLYYSVAFGMAFLVGCASSVDQAAITQDDRSSTTVKAEEQQNVPVSKDQSKHIALKDSLEQESLERKVTQGRNNFKKSEADVYLARESLQMAAGQVAHSRVYQRAPQPAVQPPRHDVDTYQYQDTGREKYAELGMNPIKLVSNEPVSTFSVDVDSGSYSNVRRMLNQGALPPKDAVRVEEMVNYFNYQYEQPDLKKAPFSVNSELALSPWSQDHVLLRVGLQGYKPELDARPAANLVFLLDVSGSMNSSNKLPLLKKSLTLLTKQLSDRDKVSIVVYAGASGVVLEPTDGNDSHKIEQALNQLRGGGSTNGEAGIELAYSLAEQAFIEGGINRVLLATDGDFNVGTSNVDALTSLIERKREKGISLTTLGFGSGNYNDHLMEQLADTGNGNYAYIDGLKEARKVLVEELSSTLMTIAKDVKVQIEFNPSVVAEYRLIGYENRMLAREDFNNDKVDAGEIGAGHKVTALYELLLQDSKSRRIDPLRYQKEADGQFISSERSQELGFLKLRFKQPDGVVSKLIEYPIFSVKDPIAFNDASEDFQFSSVVAGFGQKLRGGKYLTDFGYEEMIHYAQSNKGQDPFGYRSEFVQLIRMADALSN